ncbi:tripartite tricarboxylate transporter substrate binding protein [Desulfopila sp. IMCC35008]|uniref:tripartite tricarboxylate transporter substrate binding protein n=1 Tax=Desulfopila sp. IMCC35008 TaxID=2653858 RepID=UPI0013D23212|nr:tripartite tricarboxylate transporter substrate binding protein [Desulfopila sp. IMCC35008]
MKFTTKCSILAVLCAVLMVPAIALAEFPEKPITYTIPFNPGGESDITARLQEPELEKNLGVAVNVTHKPGGGGAVGWSDFQRTATPDGYSIIGCNIPHIIGQPLIRRDAGYKTDGFKVIMWFHFTPNALVVSKDSEFKTLEDFIEFAKKKPFVGTVGGSGTYSANHLETLRLMKTAGIDLTYVPYTGTGPVIPALMGGHIKAAMTYTPVSVNYKDKFRTLAVAAEERVPAMPDVPTFKELGYDIVGGAFRGVAAPLGTPQPVVDKLAKAFTEANKQISKKQVDLGFVMKYSTGDDAVKLIDTMRAAYGDVLADIKKK